MERKAVIVVGASADRTKFSNKSVRAHLKAGWDVYLVNPKGGEIEGLKTYPTVGDVPVNPNRVTLYLPPAAGIKVLAEIATAKPGEFFVNPGAESEELIAEARRLGLDPIQACSIVDLGHSPAQYPD